LLQEPILIASRLLESSADLHDVRDFLGHANITTTSRYVRSTPVRLAQALERMEAAAETIADAQRRAREWDAAHPREP